MPTNHFSLILQNVFFFIIIPLESLIRAKVDSFSSPRSFHIEDLMYWSFSWCHYFSLSFWFYWPRIRLRTTSFHHHASQFWFEGFSFFPLNEATPVAKKLQLHLVWPKTDDQKLTSLSRSSLTKYRRALMCLFWRRTAFLGQQPVNTSFLNVIMYFMTA